MTRPVRFVGYDEGKQVLGLYSTDRPDEGWTLALDALPLARDLQSLGSDRILAGYDRGFFEIEASSGALLSVTDRWRGVTSVHRRADETTLVTGLDLEAPGLNVLTLDRAGALVSVAHREGHYVRLLRTTPSDTYLLCCDDHILETRTDLSEIRRLAAPGFRHAWMPHRFADGSTLVSGGYGAFLARFGPEGELLQTFGRAGQVPDEVEPFFYAGFQIQEDGRILVANWQGHGPNNGSKGRQLVEFAPDGRFLGAWSAPARISALQGLVVVAQV